MSLEHKENPIGGWNFPEGLRIHHDFEIWSAARVVMFWQNILSYSENSVFSWVKCQNVWRGTTFEAAFGVTLVIIMVNVTLWAIWQWAHFGGLTFRALACDGVFTSAHILVIVIGIFVFDIVIISAAIVIIIPTIIIIIITAIVRVGAGFEGRKIKIFKGL